MRLKVKKISNNGSEAPVILVLMKVLLLCTFSGLLSFEACSLDGLTASLISSAFAEIATRCIRKQRIGYAPVPSSARRLPSSADLDWEVWPMCWITRQSFRMRTSLISHGAQVSVTQGISNPSVGSTRQPYRGYSSQRAPLGTGLQASPSMEKCVFTVKNPLCVSVLWYLFNSAPGFTALDPL